MTYPAIIQGGMGVGVSNWTLARAVSKLGQLGVVSGTALDAVFLRRLQQGDPGGHMRRAAAAFPVPAVARRVLERYFVAEGKAAERAYRSKSLDALKSPVAQTELLVLANFAEVWLAKEGHDGLVGVNYLEKVQLPTLACLFGAMLAGVDYVLMGAGIPRNIPGVLDKLAAGEATTLPIQVTDAGPADTFHTAFDPAAFFEGAGLPALKRPQFLAIISSAVLAMTLARKATGEVNGFVIEGATAGGHNAPPRGPLQLTARGEPVYSDRDRPDLEKIRALGLPFWLAGSFATPEKLAEARALGAAGVQVGTAFAFCEESGIDPALKARVIAQARDGLTDVFTDPLASPTGFPFKVLQLPESLSEQAVYDARVRVCDLGYLREPYVRPDGGVGYRCPAEDVEAYVAKGGALADTAGRRCLCNGLLAAAGLGQVLTGAALEPPILMAGDDLRNIAAFLPAGQTSYTAGDVIRRLLA